MKGRILFVTTVPITAERFLVPFALHFRSLGYRIDLATQRASFSRECRSAFDSCIDVSFSRRPTTFANLRAAFRLRSLISASRYDIVHVHTPVASFLTRIVAGTKRDRPVIIYTAHGFHFHPGGSRLRNEAYVALERLCSTWTDYLLVMNDADFRQSLALNLVRPERLLKIPGIGVDLDHFDRGQVSHSAIAGVRASLGLAETDSLFTVVAEFSPGKRHRDAVAALARLAREDVHLAFAGTGRDVQAVATIAQSLGVDKRVHFLGHVSDVRPLLVASAGLLLPSDREGLPRSVLEAMALRVPVIASRIRGNEDALQGGCGLLHAAGDASAIAAQMQQVLEDRSLAERVVDAARIRVERYSLPHVIRIHERLYEDAVNK